MAEDQSQLRVPIRPREFDETVEQQVEGPLRDAMVNVGVSPERLIEEAREAREEILREISDHEAKVLDLRRRLRAQGMLEFSRVGSLLLGSLVALLALLDPFLAVPQRFVWAALASVGILVALVPLLLPRLERRAGSRGAGSSHGAPSESPLSLRDQLTAAKANYCEALLRAIQRWLTDRANQALGSIYSTSLPDVDPRGLAEIDEPEHEISTISQKSLEAQIDHMPGGSVGVSGPRGVGKTTLLQRLTIQARKENPEKVEAALVVDAPVEYDARDFVLHLFAKLCESVLDSGRVESMRSWDRGFALFGSRRISLRSLAPFPPYLGPVLFGIGLIAYLTLLDVQGKLEPQEWEPWAQALMAIGGFLTYVSVLASAPRWLPYPFRGFRPLKREDDVELKAERYLRQIWYQRTFSSGWSGGIKVPMGLQVGGERGTQLAENQLSLPDVVSLYRAFAKDLVRRGQVRVGIDELDKMDDDRARRFLNEIKVIFRVAGCFYFVSVSEDAMAYFERRGLPFRDVFDSSFDAICRVQYLSHADSRRLIGERVVGLPAQFTGLAHVLGGGLPRDVIRVSRSICEYPPGANLAEVTDRLGVDQLKAKCSAARVASRRLHDPLKIGSLGRWLRAVDAASADLPSLLERCQDAEKEFIEPLGPQPEDPDKLKEYREALSIGLEVITFAYFTATIRSLMPTLDTAESARGAFHDGSIDRLAEARQAFASNPAEAWDAISAAKGIRDPRGSLPFPGLPEESPVHG
ncbi:MAG TPA: P-loop NTPase fold protein [Solirubrobacterales bacterium]|nr:P-loop NTPase fold protein [Solirubrobacterales bacterium]